MSFSDGEHYSF